MARGGHAGEVRVRGGDEATEMALVAEELAGEVADVHGVEFAGLEVGEGEALLEHFTDAVRELATVARPVGGKVGLVAADDIDWTGHGPPRAGECRQG